MCMYYKGSLRRLVCQHGSAAVTAMKQSLLSLLLSLSVLGTFASSQRMPHRFKTMTSQKIKSVVGCNEIDSLRDYDFPAILRERIPGTESHAKVKEYIVSRLGQLDQSRWNVTEHSFEQSTVIGKKRFTNIVATLDPEVNRRLVLVAHYDSKILSNGVFLGATDSALPVALLLNVALALDDKLKERKLTDVSLQLIFTDGEEAFQRWSSTDSLYGARQLAADMNLEGGLLSVGDKSGIEAIEAFILFDLIGTTRPYPSFHDHFEHTTNVFQRIARVEKRLHDAGHLEDHPRAYFSAQTAFGLYGIEDDHLPFMRLGVPIVHLIAYPFPEVWHKVGDNANAIDWTFVSNFRKIVIVFLHEYFHLK